MSLLSTTATSVFINTTTRAGTVILPSTFLVPGRVVTLKDIGGSLPTNNLRITTNNLNQTTDIGSFSTILTDAYGWTTLAAGNNNKWYTIGGTQMHTVTASTVQSVITNASNISTANIGTSTIAFQDRFSGSTNTLSMMSSLLYYSWRGTSGYQSTIVSGSKQATGGIFLSLKVPFTPYQLANLSLWLDGSDLNTLTFGSNNTVSRWMDKSRNNYNFTVSGTAAPYITTLGGGLNFTANKYLSSYPANPTNETCFIVFRPNVSATGFIIGSTAAGGREMGFNTSVNAFGLVNALVGWGAQTATRGIGTDNIGTTLISGGNSTQVGVSGNGLGSAVGITALSAGLTQLGGEGNSLYYNGFTYEIIAYTRALNQLERQQVEGYLAWKRNLVSILPPSHPFKFIPP